jgi:hypothetical protein
VLNKNYLLPSQFKMLKIHVLNEPPIIQMNSCNIQMYSLFTRSKMWGKNISRKKSTNIDRCKYHEHSFMYR